MATIKHQYKTGASLYANIWNVIVANYDTSEPPCTHSLWPNIVCAASNLFVTGLPALYMQWDNHMLRTLIAFAILASTVYHLAEIKSRLPGLPGLRNHARWLIQLDRLLAGALMLYVVVRWAQNPAANMAAPVVGLAGAACALIGERHIGWHFVAWHSVWHNCAFLGVALLQ